MLVDISLLPLEKGCVYVRERMVDIESRSKRTVELQRSSGEKNGNRGPRLGWIQTKGLGDGIIAGWNSPKLNPTGLRRSLQGWRGNRRA